MAVAITRGDLSAEELRGASRRTKDSYQAAPHVAAGTLEIVLERYEIDPPPVSIVYPQGRRVPQKLRAFADFAMPRIRDSLGLIDTQCSAP